MPRTLTGRRRCRSELLEHVPSVGRQSALLAFSLHQRRLPSTDSDNSYSLGGRQAASHPDNELLDPKVCRDPKTGKQTFILCSIVCCLLLGKVHLDYVLEVLSGGCDKQHASTGALQRKGTIKVHQPLFACFFDGDARFRNFFIWCWRPLCYEFCQ